MERNISALLTLTKINGSQEEMGYITRMRNMILFQISCRNDYRHLEQKFLQRIILEKRNVTLFRECLRHSFSEIMKYSVFVHNPDPFRFWTTIIIDNPQTTNDDQMRAVTDGRSTETKGTDRFLVPTFRDLVTNDRILYLNRSFRRLNTNFLLNLPGPSNVDYCDPTQESTWRRLYDSNITFFFCKYEDFILYVKEQICEFRPVNVFREIMQRQIGSCFRNKAVLRSVASPYYYVLPYQDEQKYATLTRNRILSHYRIERNSPSHMAYQFLSELQVVKASFLKVVE